MIFFTLPFILLTYHEKGKWENETSLRINNEVLFVAVVFNTVDLFSLKIGLEKIAKNFLLNLSLFTFYMVGRYSSFLSQFPDTNNTYRVFLA